MRFRGVGTGVRTGGFFVRFLKFGFLFIFLMYLFITIIMTAVSERDLGVVVKELGEEFYVPLHTAQEYALEIQRNPPQGFLGTIWEYWGFYFNLYKIYLWIWVLVLPVNLIFKDSNPPMIRYGMAIFIFLVIQVLFSVIYLNESPNAPFYAIRDVFAGLQSLFTSTNLDSGSERFIESNNTCLNETCVI